MKSNFPKLPNFLLSSQAVFFNYLVISTLARCVTSLDRKQLVTDMIGRCQLQLHRLGDLTYRLWSHFKSTLP